MALSRQGAIYVALLTILISIQGNLYKRLTSPGSHIPGLMLMVEITKAGLCLGPLALGSGPEAKESTTGSSNGRRRWSLIESAIGVGPPALIYPLSNYLLHWAQRQMSVTTFNMLMQSKMVFTPLALFIILDLRQSKIQLGAMAATAVAMVMLIKEKFDGTEDDAARDDEVAAALMVLVAGALSGVASAWCQRTVKSKGMSASRFSLELSICSGIVIAVQMWWKGQLDKDVFNTIDTGAPVIILSNAVTGLMVGLVVKHCDGVVKMLSVTTGVALSIGIDMFLSGSAFSIQKLVVIATVILATVVHSLNPPPPHSVRS